MSTVIAVDAMGGDRAPGAAVEGAVQAADAHGVGVVLVGPEGRPRAELARHDRRSAASVRVVDAPDVVAMDEAPLAALRRKPPIVDSRRGRRGRGRRRGRALQRRALGRDRARGARGVRHAARRRSSGAGRDGADARRGGGPARRRRESRVPARTSSSSSRTMGSAYAQRRAASSTGRVSGCCRLARKRARATT